MKNKIAAVHEFHSAFGLGIKKHTNSQPWGGEKSIAIQTDEGGK